MYKRILNIGICTVDAIGQYVDEYPRRRGLVLFDHLTLTTGGNAVNCSLALRKLGVPCGVVVKVGRDVFGDFIRHELETHGVDTRGLVVGDDAGTPFTFVCAHRDGERSFIHTQGTNATLKFEDIDLDLVERADIVFVTGTMVMPAFDGLPAARLLEHARAHGAVTLLDTVYADQVPRDRWRELLLPCLPHVDYFVPSLPEARLLAEARDPRDMAAEFRAAGCRNVIIKMDADGAWCETDGGERFAVRAYRVERPVDTTGAGDSWCAGLLAGLAQGWGLVESVRLGHAVAAHCIRHTGASAGIPPMSEVQDFQRTHPGGEVQPET